MQKSKLQKVRTRFKNSMMQRAKIVGVDGGGGRGREEKMPFTKLNCYLSSGKHLS